MEKRDYEVMEKEELLEVIKEMEMDLERLKDRKGRKDEVLEILREGVAVSIKEISKRLGISCKNVSSQLSYLRADNYNICTDKDGKKFIV